MVQINDLIVVEVPKDSERHEIIGNNLRYIPHGGMSVSKPYESLPPGNYEIIGLKSSMNDLSNRDYLQMILKIQKAGVDYARTESIYEFLLKHGINIETLETDLLFIKKLPQ